MTSLTEIAILLLTLSTCLQGNPVKELSIWFEKLNSITCKEAVELYTPVKVEECCIRDAIESFRKGLHTLSDKCSEDLEQGDGWETIDNLYMFLTHMAGQMTSKPTGRFACKVNRKMPFQDFREKLIRLIQQVNSQH